MKKVLLLAVAGMFVLASCKKDRSCICKSDDGSSEATVIKESSKKDAKAVCDTWSSLNTAFGGQGCELN